MASLTRARTVGGPSAAIGSSHGHSAANCQLCQTPFNIARRRHHCRACGRSVCSDCSPHYRCLPELGHTAAVRHCSECEEKAAVSAGSQTPPMRSFSNLPLPNMESPSAVGWGEIDGGVERGPTSNAAMQPLLRELKASQWDPMLFLREVVGSHGLRKGGGGIPCSS